ncbi:hypothetical protein [Aliivibrio fischeri]|uniref:hypothetical protein n=1 Tax=Aliivibrio fischeri TaxID=668 RepID=UPI0012DAEB22|nr:hypothetical protein [Aliivibrio fischeri]MUJ24418.1 hypothetical protein [Aliivibrio fischeri]
MRPHLPSCVLINDDSDLSKEFVWSLRYSTHCSYYLKDPSLDFFKYKFFSSIDQYKNKANESFFYIDSSNGTVSFDVKTCPDNHSGIENKIFNKSFESGVFNEPSNTLSKYLCSKDKNITEVSYYLLYDFSGEVSIVGTLLKCDDSIVVINHNDADLSEINNLVVSGAQDVISDDNLLINIRFNIKSNNIIKSVVTNQLDHYELKVLRSVGINLPLVIVQNLYKRKVKTFVLMDIDNVQIDKNIEYNNYYNTIYFDLDETLVWLEQPIEETIALLNKFHNKGFCLKLLTRHKKNIANTLSSISVDINVFNEIIKVEDGEKKSQFVTGNSLFIDNEFPERYDVKFNGNVNSIDLDQLEFINI